METFSALQVLCAGNSPVTGEFPAQGPVTRSFDVYLIFAWINGWVNSRKAGDSRRHQAPYDVTVMLYPNLAIAFPADDLAPSGAKPTGTMLTTYENFDARSRYLRQG